MKWFGVFLSAMLGFATLARAAEPPTTKALEQAPNCFASFWSWLNSSADDCPLSYAGVTLYGTLDVGYGYQTHGAPFNGNYDKGVAYKVQRFSNRGLFLWSPNALSSSTIGLKMEEPLGYGWSLIGVLESGVNPYSGMFMNPLRSLTDNNVNTLAHQSANGDSSRNGSWWDNSQGFASVSNQTYGALSFGRMNSLAAEVVSAYDPVGSNAFSLLSGSYGGFGNTELARVNTAFRYRLTYENFRVGALAQVGGYAVGNGSMGQYQVQVGVDFGGLSLDAVVNWAKDAVSLSNFAGAPPAGYDVNTVLRGTLSNNSGALVVARYFTGPWKLYAGYIRARSMNPTDDFANGFPTIAEGIIVPAGAVTFNAFDVNRILQTEWIGAQYSIRDDLEVSGGLYYHAQNDYLPAPAVCTGSGINTSSRKCAGSQGALSGLIDWKPVARVDLYAGVMVSNRWGGFASGALHQQSIDPTVGLRVKF